MQENVLKQGDQSNESALEQAKDEQISGECRWCLCEEGDAGQGEGLPVWACCANERDTLSRFHPRQVQVDHGQGVSCC